MSDRLPKSGLSRRDARSKGHPDFYFSEKSRRYHYKGPGGFVSQSAFEQLTRKYIDALEGEFDGLYSLLQKDFVQFQKDGADLIRYSHFHQYVLGRGGMAKMTPDDFKALKSERDYQYGRWRRMAQQIKSGDTSLAQVRFRLRMYTESSKVAYWDGARAAAIAAGMTEERNVLGQAEHCPDCMALWRKGWKKIGTFPLPTKERVCGPFCYCSLEFR